MTIYTYSTVANNTLPVLYGTLTSSGANVLTWSDGVHTTSFLGNFTFDAEGGVAGGVITGYRASISGVQQVVASDLNVPVMSALYYLTHNTPALTYLMFGGDDSITGSASADLLNGYGGADTIHGGAGNDTIFGGGGQDSLYGDAGNDSFTAGGYAACFGGAGNDTYNLTSGVASVTESANGGTDTVLSNFSSILSDNVENLTLGGTATAYGTGNGSANTLIGNNSSNLLQGLGGNDSISGSGGDDRIAGGLGNDVLTGGAGNDAFLFDTAYNASTNSDTILDFSRTTANTDKIHFDNDVFLKLGAPHTLKSTEFYDIGHSTLTAATRITYNRLTGIVSYDPDGKGGLAAIKICTVGATTHPVLTYNDFYVVE